MTGLRHELLLYEDDDRLADAATAFLAEGLEAGEAVVTVLEARKLGIMREALAPQPRTASRGSTSRGITPGPRRRWPTTTRACGRSCATAPRASASSANCRRSSPRRSATRWIAYDAILNRAFDHQPVSILCGYDGRVLPDRVLEAARRTHPRIRGGGPNADFGDPAEVVRANTPPRRNRSTDCGRSRPETARAGSGAR